MRLPRLAIQLAGARPANALSRAMGILILVVLAVSGCKTNGANLTHQYANTTALFVAMGRMRRDRAPDDAPFSDAELASNFEEIAFNHEMSYVDGAWVNQLTPTNLTRWTDPIRITFGGNSIGPDGREMATVVAKRLSAATGVPITLDDRDPNVFVLMSNSLDMIGVVGAAARRLPVEEHRKLRAITARKDIPCWVSTKVSDTAPDEIVQALIVINGEAKGRLREACFNEEMAQMMGLFNDSKTARPSVFNDDNEFAVLTEHDILLLRLLYHHDLKPGMTAEEMRPIIPAIIAKLRANDG